jgi:hypothetical protein
LFGSGKGEFAVAGAAAAFGFFFGFGPCTFGGGPAGTSSAKTGLGSIVVVARGLRFKLNLNRRRAGFEIVPGQ